MPYYSKHKYHAKPTTVTMSDGTEIKFDSKREAEHFCELCLRERAGEIADLQRQVKYELVPEQREPDGIGKRGGRIKGKVIERPVTYLADFVYTEDGDTVVEDVKGVRTKEYVIKRKLMLYRYGIKIREVK